MLVRDGAVVASDASLVQDGSVVTGGDSGPVYILDEDFPGDSVGTIWTPTIPAGSSIVEAGNKLTIAQVGAGSCYVDALSLDSANQPFTIEAYLNKILPAVNSKTGIQLVDGDIDHVTVSILDGGGGEIIATERKNQGGLNDFVLSGDLSTWIKLVLDVNASGQFIHSYYNKTNDGETRPERGDWTLLRSFALLSATLENPILVRLTSSSWGGDNVTCEFSKVRVYQGA